MAAMDPSQEELFLGVAHALFMNRLHVLRLTEIVRLNIRPSADDGNMDVPPQLDRELIQSAVDYVLKCFPPTFHKKIQSATAQWLRLA
jgi:hypothetical protein